MQLSAAQPIWSLSVQEAWAALLLLPALGAIFALGPFPLRWLPLLALSPPLIVLADDLRKAWRPAPPV